MMEDSIDHSLFFIAKKLLTEIGIHSDFQVETIRQEASHRSYYRLLFSAPVTHLPTGGRKNSLATKDSHSVSSLILCQTHPIENEKEDDFLNIAETLAENGIPVPKVYALDATRGYMLQSDGGTGDLTALLLKSQEIQKNRDPGNGTDDPVFAQNIAILREQLLFHALELMIRLQGIDPPPVVAARFFDFDKLSFEMSFLFSKMEDALGKPPGWFSSPLFMDEVLGICKILGEAREMVFTHRDYHGRNILLQDWRDFFSNAKQRPALPCYTIVDFQDARMGTPYYDLVSLLYDPYSFVSEHEQSRCLEFFFKNSYFQKEKNLLFPQAIQRLLKALGSYFYLSNEKKMSHYRKYIPVTLRTLVRITEDLHTGRQIHDFAANLLDFLEQ